MFPLAVPLGILRRRAIRSDWVLDPFCGRGTTNFAARLLGLSSLGVDSSPVASAITASKLVHTNIAEIMCEARKILSGPSPQEVPRSEFWRWAYHPRTLDAICRFRESFLRTCSSPPRLALRGVVLGALHGPRQKTFPSYFSNQCPRTYAPKQAYATRYWRKRGLLPPFVDALSVIERRATRYYGSLPLGVGVWRLADSRKPGAVAPVRPNSRFQWVITSPPYYGMRTYRPDQWLRSWFLGGREIVDYTNRDQLRHSSPEDFATDLAKVWHNVVEVCAPQAQMVIRFGGIRDRRANPLDIIKRSLAGSGWRIQTIVPAGNASEGKRQANAFLRSRSKPVAEYDIWAAR
jgi:hypothetical protein